jgi:hypothetical protein
MQHRDAVSASGPSARLVAATIPLRTCQLRTLSTHRRLPHGCTRSADQKQPLHPRPAVGLEPGEPPRAPATKPLRQAASRFVSRCCAHSIVNARAMRVVSAGSSLLALHCHPDARHRAGPEPLESRSAGSRTDCFVPLSATLELGDSYRETSTNAYHAQMAQNVPFEMIAADSKSKSCLIDGRRDASSCLLCPVLLAPALSQHPIPDLGNPAKGALGNAGGGNRTRTEFPPPDFESGASTSSATPAQGRG